MRKFTLMLLLAASLTTSVKAQSSTSWMRVITTTTTVDDLYAKAPLAIDDNGNTYLTGTFTKDLDFGSSYLTPTATSAFVAKDDETGEAKWAAGLLGAATITSITTDAEGYVYLAGVFADAVNVVDRAGQTYQTIHGMADQTEQVSAFIVKYDQDGNVKGVKTIIPEIAKTDDSYFMPAPVFTPKKIQIVGDRLVLAATYKTDCKIDDNLTVKGQYGFQDWGYTWDVATMGVISLSKDLKDAKLLVQLAATEETTTIGYGAEDINFTAEGNDITVGFVAYGNELTLKNDKASYAINDLHTSQDGEQTLFSHAWIFTTVDKDLNLSEPVIYDTDPSENEAKYNTIDAMEYFDGCIYLAGTFNEVNPFNGSSYKGSNDAYLVCLGKGTQKVWTVTSGYEETASTENEKVTGIGFLQNKICLATIVENSTTRKNISGKGYTYSPSGNFLEETDDMVGSLTQNAGRVAFLLNNKRQNSEAEEEGQYCVMYTPDGNTTGIANVSKDATSDNSNTIIYNLDGAQVGKGKAALNSLQKGVYVISNGNEAKKIIK